MSALKPVPEVPLMTTKNTSSSSIVEDKNAGDVFSNARQVKTISADAIDYSKLDETSSLFDANIIAKPLMLPEGLSLTIRNHEYSYRWVAFKVRDGLNFDRYKNMGFEKATLADVTPSSSKACQQNGDIIFGDLLLMRIPKVLYFAHLKENYRRANAAFTRNAIMAQVDNEFPNGIPNDSSGRPLVNFYTPDKAVISKMADSK